MRTLRAIGLFGLLAFSIAAFTPLANRMNAWMAGMPHLEPSDAIVVLGRGGADADGVLTNRSLRRVLAGISLYENTLAPFWCSPVPRRRLERAETSLEGLGSLTRPYSPGGQR